jgi:coenzyme F420-reducing hydrogenase delta subunit
MVKRLLAEIGVEPERVELIHCGPGDDLEGLIRESVEKFSALGESPMLGSRVQGL